MSDLQITVADTVDRLRGYHVVSSVVMDHDHIGLPTDPLAELIPNLTPEPDDPEPTTYWTGTVDGDVVGAARASWPQREHLTAASLDVAVHPDHRRRGHGRALLTHLLEVLREAARTRAFFEVASPWVGGDGLAEPLLRSVGARPVLLEARRLLDLTALTAATVPGPTPDGYRVEQWVDRAPEALVDGLAYLSGRMTTDAPLGELDYEPERWDAARYRQREASALARNRIRVRTAVVHPLTGAVAGLTEYAVSRDQPEIAYQWDTIVDPAHRGHGLGLVLKAHNLQLLRTVVPGSRWVNTWNALSNSYMVAVNDVLGFVPVERWTEWQLDL